MTKRARRGFTLIEVLAAFVVALLLIGPIGGIIAGVAGTMAGLERSKQRRLLLQDAAMAAATVAPLQTGVQPVGELRVQVAPYEFGASRDLERAGWRLYLTRVHEPDGSVALETVRIGRL